MTALAMCERARLSGRDFLTALTLGDDVAARVLAASGVDFSKGWSPPPLFSSFGGTAIAGHLMKLSPAQIRHAFGMSVDQIGGTGQAIWDGATNWKLAQGFSARNAIISADLAKRGWSGMGDALQAPHGFYSQFTAGCVRPKLLTDELGKVFFAEEYFKPYPSCAATHPSIECALELRQKFALAPGDVDAIVLRVQPSTYGIFVSKPFSLTPSAHAQANYSLAFAVANALLRGDFTLEHYAADAMRQPQLLRLIERITIEKMPAGQPGVELQVTTADGRKLVQGRAGQASRYPKVNPVTFEQTVEKFHAQAQFSNRVPRKTAQQIVDRVAQLERETDMAAFARLLTVA
jgi:2-methylcitrate dehydratase